jgi:iron-sulfur cluster assembly protein
LGRRDRVKSTERHGRTEEEIMLTLTPGAAEVIHDLAAGQGLPSGAGLRIAPYTENGMSAFALSLSEGPAPDDTVIEARDGDTMVYVEPTASQLLADQVLDAHVDEQGEIAFLISPQSAPDAPAGA